MAISTPLGEDILLLVNLTGREAISELFRFDLRLVAENRFDIPFDQLLGRRVSIRLEQARGEQRYFHGIASRITQGVRDVEFTTYTLELAPDLWLLTRRVQSRIFQHLSVPEILKEVLRGLSVSFRLEGSFSPRDYCVQYQESDFTFASRLMEEEGIYYFFLHTERESILVLANSPQGHPELQPATPLIFDGMHGGTRPEDRVVTWEKHQEVRSGRFTAWDHTFEMPDHKLAGESLLQEQVDVGEITHRLRLPITERLEIYDFPGEYAQRFDGIDAGGGARREELPKIFADARRTVDIRIQQEAVPGLGASGASNCRQLASGHRFRLERHFDANGAYVATAVEHRASIGDAFRSGSDSEFHYENKFTCIPLGLPYRPARVTPKPIIPGTQSAVVVGPKGEEIFTDKYGRVKVQFHWDRQGQRNADSSCWVRVATFMAGRQWGAIHIPRVGHEVVVVFEEGDPDKPLIVGSVYNAANMPPNVLPNAKTISGLRTNTSLGGGGANELTFDDAKGKERIFTHAQHDQDTVVENNQTLSVGVDRSTQIGGNDLLIVGANRVEKIASNKSVEAGANIKLSAGASVLVEAGVSITLRCGASLLHMNQAGVIVLQGAMINIAGSLSTNVTAPLTTVSGMAVLTAGLLTVSEGAVVNKVQGGKTTIDGDPVKINC